MTKDRQETIRTLVPGALALLVLQSLFSTFDPTGALTQIELKAWTRPFLLAVVIGSAYKIFGFQERLLKTTMRDVRQNIDKKLLEIPAKGALNDRERAWLTQEGALINVFYKIVDGDESLRLKRDGVYENGVFLSTSIDIACFAGVGACLHLVFFAAIRDLDNAAWGLYYLAIALVAIFVLLPAAKQKHLRLSEEQLGVIAALHAKEVENWIAILLAKMPPATTT